MKLLFPLLYNSSILFVFMILQLFNTLGYNKFVVRCGILEKENTLHQNPEYWVNQQMFITKFRLQKIYSMEVRSHG